MTPSEGRAIMVQGTASHVGKSVLVAGFCRLFRQEGLRVAPFKAQNMSLNSFATPDGREIGRAQAVQAEAAGVPPSFHMNPILLKPEGNARSQVVVNGRVYATMGAAAYHRATETLWPHVEASLNHLLRSFDLVILEGAGSPVEVNLRDSDIVNMRVAQAARAPVILVADIDRGGVFASLVGTLELLDPEDRARVAGVVVNKFRGDPRLFDSGVAFLEKRLQRPVLGVVPWIDDLGIAEEDSLGLPSARGDARGPANGPAEGGGLVDVAVIRLPHIANFDDLDLLACHPAATLRYVDSSVSLGSPDVIVLPGTKTTRADLDFLWRTGLGSAIQEHAARGGAVLGICGGFQMLGKRIEDPSGVEGPAGSSDGLGLLDVTTTFAPEKATAQVQGRLEPSRGLFEHGAGTAFTGYEIHMGQTRVGTEPLSSVQFEGEAPRHDGAVSPDGWVAGTYVHGLLKNAHVVGTLVANLAARRGTTSATALPRADPYDRLADVLRTSLNIPVLRVIAGLA